jgi:hypothetical protein
LQRAKGIPVRTRKSELILVRVDSICLGNARDDCFTAIGQIVDERFVAEAMFFAGPRMNSSDARPFGASERPLVFYSKNNITSLIETSAGWIVGTSPRTKPPQ